MTYTRRIVKRQCFSCKYPKQFNIITRSMLILDLSLLSRPTTQQHETVTRRRVCWVLPWRVCYVYTRIIHCHGRPFSIPFESFLHIDSLVKLNNQRDTWHAIEFYIYIFSYSLNYIFSYNFYSKMEKRFSVHQCKKIYLYNFYSKVQKRYTSTS